MAVNVNDENEYRELFSYYDRDNDGLLLLSELGRVLRALGRCVTEKQLTEICKSYKGNTINFSDFIHIVKTTQTLIDPNKELYQSFQVFDETKCGSITPQKLREILLSVGGEPLSEIEVDEFLQKFGLKEGEQIQYKEATEILLASLQ
jgi:calmodulin